ncbi:hypothetical protein KC351_g2836 [Hortaea werneckii]|nr:hypothetical protein KC351_g2836 [Hortaea werneckii]
MDNFSTLAEAFAHPQIWRTAKVIELVKEFRALIVYQITQPVGDTFNHATTTAGTGPTEDFLDYPALPMGPSLTDAIFTVIDEPHDVGNAGGKRKSAFSG